MNNGKILKGCFLKKGFILYQTFLFVILLSGSFYFSMVFLSYGFFKILVLFLLGLFLWTFAEYVSIRFVFHSTTLNYIFKNSFLDFHHHHHLHPKDKKFLFIPLPLAALIFIIGPGFGFLLAGNHAVPAVAGFLAGYLLFTILHYSEHHYDSSQIPFLKPLWQNHFLHHNLYPDKAFGVTTQWWDKVFGTMPPEHQFLNVVPTEKREYAISKNLKLIEVTDKETKAFFHLVPRSVYRNNPFWIPPLEHEIENIFDPDKNSYFKHGTARRWIVVNAYNEAVGRIAAFIDFDKMYEGNDKIGSIGFYESVNDKEVAFYLFDQAIQWLKEVYRVNIIQGPVNFGENDKYWGLLVEGFSYPSYGMNYNPGYYRSFFEEYGFSVHYNQLTNYVSLRKPLPDRFEKIAARVTSNPRYSFKHFREKHKEAFIKDFVEIYNKAWASFRNFHPISEDYIRRSFEELKPVLEEKFIWFAYVDQKPAGLMIATPDVNQLLRYLNGRLTLFNKIKFLFYKLFRGFTSVRVIIMGIVPEYQRLGLESGMTYYAYNAGQKKRRYERIELAWVGDFNPKMIAIHNSMGAVNGKKHATYRKEICN